MKFGFGLRTLAIICAVALPLAGCGQVSKKYAGSSNQGVFFAVPNSWKLISEKDLNHNESLAHPESAKERLALVNWQEAYTPDSKLKAKDVTSLVAPTSPIAYVRVRGLTSSEIQDVSYNVLRDLLVPLSSWENGVATSIPNHNVISDDEAVQKNARGIHAVFEFENEGVKQTINQTALLSQDHRKLIILFLRCTSACYAKNQKAIENIVTSFTVGSTK
jgi:hypothetical protein